MGCGGSLLAKPQTKDKTSCYTALLKDIVQIHCQFSLAKRAELAQVFL